MPDLKVRVKLERETFDQLLDAFTAISKAAEELPWRQDLQQAAAKLGMALGRCHHEVFEESV